MKDVSFHDDENHIYSGNHYFMYPDLFTNLDTYIMIHLIFMFKLPFQLVQISVKKTFVNQCSKLLEVSFNLVQDVEMEK
jgi:hypothetical protein